MVEVADEPVDPASVFVPASERDPANEAHLIRLTRLGAMTVDAYQLEVAAAALQTIVTHSLLGQTDFVALMDRAFERGLPQMLTCVRPYDDLVDIHKDADYDAFSGADGSLIALERARSPQPADGLRWTLPANANAYDHAASLGAIRERYETLLAPVRLTLPRLATDPTFAALAASLRAEGWKDWHLLTAIANIVVNARARQMGLNTTASVTEAEVQNFHALMRAEEQLDDPETPVESFTKEAMWLHLGNAAAATARRWGLDIRVNLLDPRAFLNVLGDRFNYWSDDVEHDPLFTS